MTTNEQSRMDLITFKVEVAPSLSYDAEAVMKRLATAKVGTRTAAQAK